MLSDNRGWALTRLPQVFDDAPRLRKADAAARMSDLSLRAGP